MGFSEIINTKWAKGIFVFLNIGSIFGIFGLVGSLKTNPDTKNEFDGRLVGIILFSVLFALCWWGLSSSFLMGASPELVAQYVAIMVSLLFAMSFMSISIASMMKM